MYSVQLNWTPASTALSQEVFFREIGTTLWASAGVVSSSTNSFILTNLVDGKDYEFKIDSYCEKGIAPGNPVQLPLPCLPPTSITVTLTSM